MGLGAEGDQSLRLVVSNTGPILHLWEASALDCLRFAGDIWIPVEVDAELTELIDDWHNQSLEWIQQATLDASQAREAEEWLQADLLDRGEAAAIVLARAMDAAWFLTDDAAARVVSQAQGLETHGSLGVVLLAAATRRLSQQEAEDALGRLMRTSLWLSPRARDEASAALRTIYAAA